jgi:hypothetical protein
MVIDYEVAELQGRCPVLCLTEGMLGDARSISRDPKIAVGMSDFFSASGPGGEQLVYHSIFWIPN